jgi:hypothetical protein
MELNNSWSLFDKDTWSKPISFAHVVNVLTKLYGLSQKCMATYILLEYRPHTPDGFIVENL